MPSKLEKAEQKAERFRKQLESLYHAEGLARQNLRDALKELFRLTEEEENNAKQS